MSESQEITGLQASIQTGEATEREIEKNHLFISKNG